MVFTELRWVNGCGVGACRVGEYANDWCNTVDKRRKCVVTLWCESDTSQVCANHSRVQKKKWDQKRQVYSRGMRCAQCVERLKV